MADNFPQINALNSKCEIAKQLVRIPGFSRTTSVVSCATSIKVRNWDHKKSDRKMNQCQSIYITYLRCQKFNVPKSEKYKIYINKTIVKCTFLVIKYSFLALLYDCEIIRLSNYKVQTELFSDCLAK